MLALVFALACTVTDDSGKDTAPADTGDTSDTGDSGDSSTQDSDTGSGDSDTSTQDSDTDSGDTGDTGSGDTDTSTDDSGDSGTVDTGDSGDSGGVDTGDSGTVDTGDSGGVDTGDSGGVDTGETGSSACTETDLVLSADIRDAKGTSGTAWTPSDSLTMVAVMTNPCTTDVVFSTKTTCLFNGASVTDSHGMGMGVADACAGVVTSWTIAAGGTQEEAYSWGKLGADGYVLTVDDTFGRSASTSFTVK